MPQKSSDLHHPCRHKKDYGAEETIRNYLNEKLQENCLTGEIASLVVHNNLKGELNCYGEYIPADILLATCNLTISVGGKGGGRLSGHVRYPNITNRVSYQKGFFVPGPKFGLDKDKWVVLVNIKYKCGEDEKDLDPIPFR